MSGIFIIGIVSILVIFSVVICIVGYHYVTYSLLEQYGDGAFIAAYTATSTLDANKMDAYEKSGGETPSYKAASKDGQEDFYKSGLADHFFLCSNLYNTLVFLGLR